MQSSSETQSKNCMPIRKAQPGDPRRSLDGNFDVYLTLTGNGDLKDRLDARGITGCIARLGVGDLEDFTLLAVELR